MENKYCEGCVDYIMRIPEGLECIEHNKSGSCPCTECVVKTMCSGNDICRPFKLWGTEF